MRKRNRKKHTVLPVLILLLLVIAGGVWLADPFDKGKTPKWRDGAMLRIGETQVDYREGLVYLHAVQEEYEQYYGNDIWQYAVDMGGNTIGGQIREQILEQMIYIKIVCEQADALGIVLSEEELHDVESKTARYMEKIKDTELVLRGVNEDIVRRIYTDNVLARKTFEYVTLNVDTDISNEEAGQHRFNSIAIRNYKIGSSGERVEYSEKETKELRERMQELLVQAHQTEDFYKLANSMTEDAPMLDFAAGKGDFPESFSAEQEEALLSLKSGELSEVMETTDYYYIFYCVTDFDMDATHEKKEKIIAERQKEEFKKRYAEWRAQAVIEVNEEVWNSVQFEID